MKESLFFILISIYTSSVLSQEKKFTYSQFDFTVAFTGNPESGNINPYTREKESWFLPDGLGSKFGYGLQHNKWVALGIHGGMNWEWTNKLVVVPVFANFRLSPKISDETRITLQLGLGKVAVIGRGNLFGEYKKISLGLQTSDDLVLFIELNDYQFGINKRKNTGNVSLGISVTSF